MSATERPRRLMGRRYARRYCETCEAERSHTTRGACFGCAAREREAAHTPEHRSEKARKAALALAAKRKPEDWLAHYECGLGKLTPDQRSANGRKGGIACTAKYGSPILRLTPEQRREIARKAKAAMTPEQRREAGRKGVLAQLASLTPAQRRERVQKAAAASAAKRWTGDAATAGAVHARLRDRFGPASQHVCVECGARRPAGRGEGMHWSYDGHAPDEKRDGSTRYTTDTSSALKPGADGELVELPRWYSPRCALPCHALYDAEHGLRGD